MSHFLDWLIGLNFAEPTPEQRHRNERSQITVERTLNHPWRAID